MVRKFYSNYRKLLKRLEKSFLFTALASFLWLVYRSGTKPSRITYPCQQAAATNIWLFFISFPLVYSHRLKHFFKYKFGSRLLLKYSLVVSILFLAIGGLNYIAESYSIQKGQEAFESGPKGPTGK
ncbi:MAG: hypothetical protein JXB14_08400, partial [Candidatus Altiarchaeota archaeon]|nr:hypothetical protein [Candidatus Altiarchaeota archaeon]